MYCIKTNFSIVATSITQLETRGLSLSDSISIVYNVVKIISKVRESRVKKVAEKLQKTLEKNQGFNTESIILDILNGVDINMNDLEHLTAEDICYFKNAPITSVDVKRSFSMYKKSVDRQ